jgi:hypothetical protein
VSEPARTRRFIHIPLGPGQIGKLVSVLFAFVALFVGNVIATRHYSRWDLTESKRYSLSPPTIETLHNLPGTVEVWVLISPGDPLGESVKHLITAYRAETSKLDVKFIDPDRDTIQFEDTKRRFHIEAGRTEDGRVVADAVIVVAKDDKHWFITASDLFEVSGTKESRAKPREEEALTQAIRNVLGGMKSIICFTMGHGEMSLDDGTDRGLGQLKVVLEKDNFVTRTIDTTAPDARDPFKGCDVTAVIGPRGPFKKEESEMLRTYALSGGNILVASSPITADTKSGMQGAGLEPLLDPFGIKLADALAVERDPSKVIEGEGLGFYAVARTHAVTSGLVPEAAKTGRLTIPRVKVKFARALQHGAVEGASAALDLLATTEQAFGVTDVSGAQSWSGPPEKTSNDLAGPLILAMASERPKLQANAPHGPRAIVIASASLFTGTSWKEPIADRGAALFVDSAVSWLAAKPQLLDIPEKQSVATGLKLDDASLSDVRRYVLAYMPLAAIVLGGTIAFFRRQSEGKKRPAPAKKPKQSQKKREPGTTKKKKT